MRKDPGRAEPKPSGGRKGRSSEAGRGAASRETVGKTLFANKRQAFKARLLYWFFALACLGALYGGWAIYSTFGLSPAEGGVLRPFGQRLAFGGSVAALGVAAFVAIHIYIRRYVTRMELSGNEVGVETMTSTGRSWRVIPAGDLVLGGLYGDSRIITSRGQTVHAPWRTLRVMGEKLPLILDMQAEHIDLKALSKPGTSKGSKRN